MFITFFYMLRAAGLKPDTKQWLLLIEALDLGLADSNFSSFYYLCRSIVVTTESDFDKFDAVFLEYFRAIKDMGDIPNELLEWLNSKPLIRDIDDKPEIEDPLRDLEELLKRLEERMEEQKEKHEGGNYWIGTGGTSTQGHGGWNEAGIRVGGEGRHGRALMVAGERRFRDFRNDQVLDLRRFQTAFRKLRQFSTRIDNNETELDIDETIHKTSDNAGMLEIVYGKPRKNTVKLLVLMDSGGSMTPHSAMTSLLFQSVSKANHFKDLQFFYFHNCVYEKLYLSPRIWRGESVDTDFVLHKYGSDYKIIFVGDAAMDPSELYYRWGSSSWNKQRSMAGIDWLNKINDHYNRAVWLNPINKNSWNYLYGGDTIGGISKVFPMYSLTPDGLEEAIRKLLRTN
ncbi:MAG: VWA domain-containing protein [Clostridiales Family XIII bacterium]|jgi:uncharacterized protein with von Willebrand factor type A (vWA) domain|nr:VWA domain-containing protein [Clostridiales Family XIII bacterium]